MICDGGAGPCPLRPEMHGTERPLQNHPTLVAVDFIEAARIWGGQMSAFSTANPIHFPERLHFGVRVNRIIIDLVW